MRVTTLAKKLIGITSLVVESVSISKLGLIADVRPRWRLSRCGECGRRAPRYDRRAPRFWRHFHIGALKIYLRYSPWRVNCPHCGVLVEQVPWAVGRSGFTSDFEELVAYLTQRTDKTSVTKTMGIAWRTVGAIVERVVERKQDPTMLEGLVDIGVDEFSYRKRHNYITLVVDHRRRRVVWATEGKDRQALASFFDALGEEAAACLEHVTIDMSAAFESVVKERAPQAKIVFDRFHVQRLVSNALDEVRRELVRCSPPEHCRFIKRSRYTLLSNPWNLSRKQNQKLAEIQRNNAPLYRAYLLKEALAQALDYRQPARARRALNEWLAWASRSRLAAFVKVAGTIRKHNEGILAYIKLRLTNGLTEGINNKIRVVARRAYGFHSAPALIAMVFLCCGGLELNPLLP